MRHTKRRGVATSVATYVIALAAAALAAWVSGLEHPLADLGLGTLVATLVVFAGSVLVDNSSIYDPYWSLQPVALAGYYLWTGWASVDARQIVVTVLIVLYSVRLTANFYRGWPGLAKEDFRYEGFRERTGRAYWLVSFLGIHLFPTVMVFLGCLPLYALTRPGAGGWGWLDGVALVVTLGAILLAFAADEQLRRFRSDPQNGGRTMRHGLWGRSRHPNYLGEVVTWWGLGLFGLAAGGRWWWVLVGAAGVTVMFLAVSIPMMERRLLATREDYELHRRQTPLLLPRLARRKPRAVAGG